MPHSSTTDSPPSAIAPDGPTIADITAHLTRRIDWYGLEGMTLRAVERRGDGCVIAEIAGGAEAVYREVIDGWTGQVRERAVLGQPRDRAA